MGNLNKTSALEFSSWLVANVKGLLCTLAPSVTLMPMPRIATVYKPQGWLTNDIVQFKGLAQFKGLSQSQH